MRDSTRAVVLGGAALAVCALARGAAETPEVWLCPLGNSVFELASDDASWPYTQSHLAGLKLYIGTIKRANLEELSRLAAFVSEHKLQIAVESGGTLNHDWGREAGEKSAAVELESLAPWYAAGGKVDCLDLDGPVRRLLGFGGWGKDPAKKFTSYADCASELMDYLAAVKAVHPEIQFWLLTNFPNWGYRGDSSYHARGERRQDQGNYLEVITAVLAACRASGMTIAGATVDNPYEYAIGSHKSVNLRDPSEVNWIGRIRVYEEYCGEHGLDFNLIINSEQGGHTSDEMFYERTLDMLARYRAAGGTPARYFVQSWYEFPKELVPESAPHSMTALAKAVIEIVSGEKNKRPRPAKLADKRTITLTPRQGFMTCVARVPSLNGQSFSLVIPETIGARHGVILNFPEIENQLQWTGPDKNGRVSSSWTAPDRVRYTARLTPGITRIDLEMTVENLSTETWRDVFWFNCLNPTGAENFKDWNLERTYMSVDGAPVRMDRVERIPGTRQPTLQFFLNEQTRQGQESRFVRGFGGTSPIRTDGAWIATLSSQNETYIAATSQDCLFLFDNLDRCCIHSAPSLGNIAPGETRRAVCRFYFGHGDLEDFLARFKRDQTALAPMKNDGAPPRRTAENP